VAKLKLADLSAVRVIRVCGVQHSYAYKCMVNCADFINMQNSENIVVPSVVPPAPYARKLQGHTSETKTIRKGILGKASQVLLVYALF